MYSLKVLRLLVVGVVATFALAGTATGQSYLSGTFTLQDAVEWQGATLPPGDYSIMMDSVDGPAIVRRSSGGGAVLAVAKYVGRAREGAPTGLFLRQIGDQRVVRSFNWAEGRVTFVYKPFTRAERRTLARIHEEKMVPVRMARN